MTWLLIATAITLAAFAYYSRRTISHPVVAFEVAWAAMLVMYELRLYDNNYYELSNLAFFVLLGQLVCFPLGCLVLSKVRFVKGEGERTLKKGVTHTSLEKPIFLVFVILSAVALAINDIVVVQNLLSGNSFEAMAREGIATQEATGVRVYLMIFVVYPTIAFVSPICATEFASDTKNKKKYLLINALLVALASLDHGGRVYLINMGISYVYAFVLFGKRIRFTYKQKSILILLIVILVSIAITLSSSRGIDDLWESLYLYFSCSVPHMIARMEQPLFRDEMTLGVLSFRGILYPLYLVLHFLGLVAKEPRTLALVESISEAIEQDVFIGANVSTNAFLPMAYYFYIDFRMIGVILCVVLYGGIVGYYYSRAKQTLSKKHVAIFLMLMYGLLASFIRFPFKTYQYAIGFLYLLLFMYRKNNLESKAGVNNE